MNTEIDSAQQTVDGMPLPEFTARQWLKWGVGGWVIGPLLAEIDSWRNKRCEHCGEYLR